MYVPGPVPGYPPGTTPMQQGTPLQGQVGSPSAAAAASSSVVGSNYDGSETKAAMKAIENDAKFKVSKKGTEDTIIKYLKDVEGYLEYLKTKNAKWLTDVENLTSSMSVELANRSTRLSNASQLLPGEEPRLQKQIYHGYKKMIDSIQEKATVNFLTNKKFFLKSSRKKVNEIHKYVENEVYLLKKQNDPRYAGNEVMQNRIAKYIQIRKDYEALLVNIEAENDRFYDKLLEIVSRRVLLYGVSGAGHGADGVMLLDDDDRINITSRFESMQKHIATSKNKLKSYYSLNYNIMDMILDSQFFVLYLIKGLRILFTYIALFLATRVFSPIYEEIVYDQKKLPPALWKYLFIFLGFDAAFNVFLIVVLFLLQFLFKTDDNSFIIDKYLFYKYLTDYAFSMVVLMVMGALVAKVMMDKKYFKYKYEGLRAIRAFESVLFYIAIPLYLFPYFLIV